MPSFYFKRISDVKFYVFSDDVEWAKAQSFFNNCNFIEYETANERDLIFLMSCCKHNIIANSSFSWWGAWQISTQKKL